MALLIEKVTSTGTLTPPSLTNTRTTYVPGSTFMFPESVQEALPGTAEPFDVGTERLSPEGSPLLKLPPLKLNCVDAVSWLPELSISEALIVTSVIAAAYGRVCGADGTAAATGASLTAVTLTDLVAVLLVALPSSVAVKDIVRVAVLGLSLEFQ